MDRICQEADSIMPLDTITAAELEDILGATKRSILRVAEDESWPYQNGGNRAMQFIVALLPPEIQERIFRFRSGIDEDNISEMVRRFEIIVPDEKLKNPTVGLKVRMVCECLAVPERVGGRGLRIAAIAESYGFSKRMAYRLIDRVKKKEPLFKSTRNYGVHFPELGITLRAWDEGSGRMAIEAIMGNRRNLEEKISLYNRVCDEAEEKRLRVGTYESFLRLARKLDPAVLNFRDKGIQGLRQDIVPPIKRDYTAYRPMENLVGDQHKADYYAVNSNGEVASLELFCWLDFRTQLIWGAISYKHYNKYTVGQALMNAIRWGIPSTASIITTDWGKPEMSHYIKMLIEQLSGLGVRATEIRHAKARVRHPQAKPIEPWFGWLDRKLRNDRIPGYCKRLRDPRENELQQKELKALIKNGGLLPIPELVDRIFAVINAWNVHSFKNRGKDTGKSPLDIYHAETRNHPVTTIKNDLLEYMFLPLQDVTVKRSQVRVKHERLKTLVYYDAELSRYEGKEAFVRYDPFDPSCVWVFEAKTKRLICQAEEWGMINPKIVDDVVEKLREQNRLVKQIREKYQAYAPKKPGIPRINPHAREARQVKKARELRVLRTSLEKDELMAADGNDADIRRYSRLYSQPAVNDSVMDEWPGKGFFRLTIDDPYADED